jgi:phosphoglycolate phosphatase
MSNLLADKSLIIFDWDGTLMDSIGLIVEAMHVAAQAQGFTTSDEAVKGIIGLSLMRGIEILFPNTTDEQRQTLQADYAEYYIANSHKAPFFMGIEAMLQTLIEQGRQLAVATGKKRAGLDRVLTASASHKYFVSSRCADESGSKPDPQMLLDILQETGHSIADTVFIGDSIHDIQMAQALNMTSIAVNYGAATAATLTGKNPTYQVDSPQALIALLTSTTHMTATQS